MIRELYQKGWSFTAIAKETGFDRKTIRKYINAEQLPRSSKRTKRTSKLDPYKPYLIQRIQEGTTNCVVLLEEIRAQGFNGKSTILKNLCSRTGNSRRNRQPGALRHHLANRHRWIGQKSGYTKSMDAFKKSMRS